MEVIVPRIIFLLALAGLACCQTPQGKLIDAGGYRVHLNCTGSGTPTVMIVGGGFSFDWVLVQSEVAKFTRVCTYDPAGTAWSDGGPGPDCTSRVDEIHKLLKNADIRGPYVLVGLSAGALVARLYASQYPGDVAGAVIVDHAFIDTGVANAKPLPIPAGAADSPPAILEMTPIVITAEDDPGFSRLPEEIRKLHRWAASLSPPLPSVETAERCMELVEQAAQGVPHPLGDIPLAVISTANDAPNYPKLQEHLLALSRNSRQFIADKSFHSIEMSQPEIIVTAIREVTGRWYDVSEVP